MVMIQLRVPSSPISSSALRGTPHRKRVFRAVRRAPRWVSEGRRRTKHRSRISFGDASGREPLRPGLRPPPSGLLGQEGLSLHDEGALGVGPDHRAPSTPPGTRTRATSFRVGAGSIQCHDEEASTASAHHRAGGSTPPVHRRPGCRAPRPTSTDRMRSSGSTATTSSALPTRSRVSAPVPAPRSTTLATCDPRSHPRNGLGRRSGPESLVARRHRSRSSGPARSSPRGADRRGARRRRWGRGVGANLAEPAGIVAEGRLRWRPLPPWIPRSR